MNLFSKNITAIKDLALYFLNHIVIVFIIITILCLSMIFVKKREIYYPEQVETQEIFISGISLNNWGTWFTGIGLVITALWSVLQYNNNKLNKQQEKASEIAKDFADNLIERMGLISAVLMNNVDVQNYLKLIVESKPSQFTVIEITEIIQDEDCFNNIESIIYSKETQKRYKKLLKKLYTKKETEKFDSHFPVLVENTLNKLEAICMNISSNAAGSQFIYESLHQVFLHTVEILAIKMSSNNLNNVDKYYINIISVYNMWNKQKAKDIRKLNRTNRKISRLQKKADNEVKKLLNKQTRTV